MKYLKNEGRVRTFMKNGIHLIVQAMSVLGYV